MHFSCHHGVVYYINFLFWTESARDHVDGLLSFHTFPTCFISDVSGQVSRHMNNRTEQAFFQPNDGRLASPTQENIGKAIEKKLKIQLPWVKNLANFTLQSSTKNINRWNQPHPVTNTTERYALYDRFHQKNQKRPEEKMRSLNLCPELRAQVNSAVAEQFNRELAAIRYSLTQMNEVHFKQTVRVLVELHNLAINNQFIRSVQKHCSATLGVGEHGIATFASCSSNIHICCKRRQTRQSFGSATICFICHSNFSDWQIFYK